MITTTRIAIIFCLAAVSFTSCNTGNSITSFSSRKYTSGYFANSPGAKPEVSHIATTTGRTNKPRAIETPAVKASINVKSTINNKQVIVSSPPYTIMKKPALVEKTTLVSFNTNKPIAKDTLDPGLRQERRQRLEEVCFAVVSAAALVLAFIFISTSVLLYVIFVLFSLGMYILATLIDDHLPCSIIIRVAVILLGFAVGLGVLIIFAL